MPGMTLPLRFSLHAEKACVEHVLRAPEPYARMLTIVGALCTLCTSLEPHACSTLRTRTCSHARVRTCTHLRACMCTPQPRPTLSLTHACMRVYARAILRIYEHGGLYACAILRIKEIGGCLHAVMHIVDSTGMRMNACHALTHTHSTGMHSNHMRISHC